MPETAYKAGAFGAQNAYKLFIDPYRPQIFASYISGFRAPGLIGFPPPAASPYKPYKTCAQGGAYKFFIDFLPPCSPQTGATRSARFGNMVLARRGCVRYAGSGWDCFGFIFAPAKIKVGDALPLMLFPAFCRFRRTSASHEENPRQFIGETVYKAGSFGPKNAYKNFIDPYRVQNFFSYISGFRAPGLIGFPLPAASLYSSAISARKGGL